MIYPDRRTVLTLVAASALTTAGACALNIKEATVPTLYPVLNEIIAAWKKGDVEGVLVHVTDDIVWRNSSGFSPPVVGKTAMRAALQPMAAVIERDTWRNFAYAERGNTLFVEGVDEFWLRTGQHIAIPYAAVFEFSGQRVREWREYFDGRISAAHRGGAALSDEVKALISRPEV